jgi:hypothetical protein
VRVTAGEQRCVCVPAQASRSAVKLEAAADGDNFGGWVSAGLRVETLWPTYPATVASLRGQTLAKRG